MKSTYTSVFSYLRVAIAGTLVLAAVAIAVTATKMSAPLQAEKAAFRPQKRDADMYKPGLSLEARPAAEVKNPFSSPEIEAYLLRAFPESEVSGEATLAAQSGWAALNASAHSPGNWQLIGPSKPTYPAVLDPFLFDGLPYVASGRTIAFAIAPTCTVQNCTLYVGAAGGGVWKTTKALSGNPGWQFISGSFGINAIGALLMDPSDPSGKTVYAATGEEHASGDSEAGVGVYKTTDGGATWTLVPGSDIFFQRGIGELAIDNSGTATNGQLLVPIGSAIRGVSSVTSGASSSAATGHPLATRGLYRCDLVATCTLIFADPPPVRGSNTVKVDPTHPGTIYVNSYQGGIWRSLDNGATWSQIFAPQDPTVAASAIDRSEFDVTTLPSGATRMYVGEGQGGGAGHHSNFFRSDDVSSAAFAPFVSMGGAQVDNYCSGQCWYDNRVYTPKGYPDIVYLGGSFAYGQLHGPSNGRAWLLSTDGGATWSDLTQDGNPNHANGMHPDQHAITTVPGNPFMAIFGSDGGVMRTDGKFANVAYKCDSRGLSPADNAFCKSLLNRVPNQLINMNEGLSTLQFQSFSISKQRPKNLIQGGTQDNGTFQYNGSAHVWPQIIYGDGGQSGFMVTNDKLRFNTFTGQANDVNFRDGDPTKWVIATGPIISSPEASYFYPPIIADPNPANAGSIFQGSFSVWRTQDWAGNQAFLEANCPEFTTSAADPSCGDFVRIGDGVPSTDLGSGAWGTRAGGAVAWIERARQNSGSMWAATGAGRVFITDNANDPAASVHWYRLDDSAANDPARAISAIAVDSANADHAWVAYNGYNVNTPAQPGHVFEVSRTPATSTATWMDVSYNLPDFPITALVRDDKTGDLYAGSDFGVMKLPFGTTVWVVAGAGLPNVEVPGLTIDSSARLLYAATHGRSGWMMTLP